MSVPRKHHFIPRFYLGGFTPTGTPEDKLHVFSLTNAKHWESSPGDAAHQRDFYMLELDDAGDPMALEKLLSTFEGKGAEALRFLEQERLVPQGEMLDKLLEFMALMAVRVPAAIDAMTTPMEQLYRSLLWMATGTKAAWEATKAGVEATGENVASATWEEMRDYVRSDEYEIVIPQNSKMMTLLDSLATVRSALIERKWTLVEADERNGHFICSDRPLSLHWRDGKDHGPMQPGFMVEGTWVVFPVNKRLALLGAFDDVAETQTIPRSQIALINSCTATNARRFLLSPTQDFIFSLGGGVIGTWNDFKRQIDQAIAKGKGPPQGG